MIPRVASTGTSFAGAGLYYLNDRRDQLPRPSAESYMLHDKGGRQSAQRVGFTITRNLPTDNPQTALRCMSWLAQHAKDVRQAWVAACAKAAGVSYADYVRQHNPFRGRQGSKPVYTLSIAWHPTKQARPTREQMIAAADEARHALGMGHCQCLIVEHKDTAHPHVHLIINRVCPETGRYASTGNDFLKLSAWALDYEKRTGLILCHERLFNWQRRDSARADKIMRQRSDPKARGQYVRAENVPRRDYDWFKAHAHLTPDDIRQARAGRQERERSALKTRQIDRSLRHEGLLTRRFGLDLARARQEIDRLKYAEWWRKKRDRDPIALLLAPRHAFQAAVELMTARAYFRPRRLRRLEKIADALQSAMRSARTRLEDRALDETRRIGLRHAAEVRRDDERIERLARRRSSSAAGERSRKAFNIRGNTETAALTGRPAHLEPATQVHHRIAGSEVAEQLRRTNAFVRLLKSLGARNAGKHVALGGAPVAIPRDASSDLSDSQHSQRPTSFDTGEHEPDYEKRMAGRVSELQDNERQKRRRRHRPRGRSRKMT